MSDAPVSQGTTLASPEFKQKLASLYTYLITKLGVRQAPYLKLINNESNAKNPFGFTGHYDHTNRTITLYITGRHDTDILRSFAHEVIHHWQNERGTLTQRQQLPASSEGQHTHYAQEDPWLRRREMEAYLFGNILFRDWQDEQRMGPPAVPTSLPQPLDENLAILGAAQDPESGGEVLKNIVEKFVGQLISSGILSSYHRNLTSGDMQANDFAEDLSHDIMSAIENWVRTVNNRGDRENDETSGTSINQV